MKKRLPDKPVEDLIADLKSQAVFVKKTAVMQLEKKKAVVAVPALVELLKDGEATIRGCVAWVLGELGDSSAQDGLLEILKDMDSSVRRAAAQALSKVGNPEALPSLERLQIDADRYVREACEDAIIKIRRRHGMPVPENLPTPRKARKPQAIQTVNF